jgi:hypothetical protein
MKKGLNPADWRAAGGSAGVDPKGFSVTTDRTIAEAWANFRSAERGGSPVVLEADRTGLPLRSGGRGDYTDRAAVHQPPELLISEAGDFSIGTAVMAFLMLNLYGDETHAELDTAEAVRQLQNQFDDASISPHDPLNQSAERAETFFAEALRLRPGGPERTVVETLRRNASQYGPALAFTIPVRPNKSVLGSVRRTDITFNFSEPLPLGLESRLVDYLKSFGVGRIERSSGYGEASETLFDFNETR